MSIKTRLQSLQLVHYSLCASGASANLLVNVISILRSLTMSLAYKQTAVALTPAVAAGKDSVTGVVLSSFLT